MLLQLNFFQAGFPQILWQYNSNYFTYLEGEEETKHGSVRETQRLLLCMPRWKCSLMCPDFLWLLVVVHMWLRQDLHCLTAKLLHSLDTCSGPCPATFTVMTSAPSSRPQARPFQQEPHLGFHCYEVDWTTNLDRISLDFNCSLFTLELIMSFGKFNSIFLS